MASLYKISGLFEICSNLHVPKTSLQQPDTPIFHQKRKSHFFSILLLSYAAKRYRFILCQIIYQTLYNTLDQLVMLAHEDRNRSDLSDFRTFEYTSEQGRKN